MNTDKPSDQLPPNQGNSVSPIGEELSLFPEYVDLEPKPVPEVQGLKVPNYIKSEVNFLRYPFFALTTRDLRKIDRIEYEEEREDHGQTQSVYWKVSRNIDYTIPGPFDRRIYRAIEQILDGLSRPIPQVVKIGSVNHLCQIMGLRRSSKDGKFAGIYKRLVKLGLKKISLTGVESENAFYSKAHRKWVPKFEGTFHLFDVYFRGQLLPNGEISDAIYLSLNPFYVASLNAYYVRPLDYEYMRALRTPLTQRLYEVLGLKFRGLRNSRYIRFEYEQLCHLLPITPQKSLKDAKKILKPHHKKLQDTGFIAEVEWQASQSRPPWKIVYWPGKKAKEEIKRAKELPQLQPKLTDAEERLLYIILDVCRDEENRFAYLKAIRENPAALIEMAASETRQAFREGKIKKNRGAYFMDTLKRLSALREYRS